MRHLVTLPLVGFLVACGAGPEAQRKGQIPTPALGPGEGHPSPGQVTATTAPTATSELPLIGVAVDELPILVGKPFSLTIFIRTFGGTAPILFDPPLDCLELLNEPIIVEDGLGTGEGADHVPLPDGARSFSSTFRLMSAEPGKYLLGPFVAEVDGKKYKGPVYSLEVVPAQGAGDHGEGEVD
ncbi:MAG: BatD family protein [Proteobacteria bacterium]|jgi:hypothetical protein|nr:BatD family protein [Pseudomonadota bacterium]